MKNDRNRLIDAIIATTLSYKNDTVCLSDHIDATRATIIYYVKEFICNHNNTDTVSVYSAKGRVYLRLLEDAPRFEVPDISDLSDAVREKYYNLNSYGFNTEHDAKIEALYETIGTKPPTPWVSKPFTIIKCASPLIDLRLDGHMSLTEISDALDSGNHFINAMEFPHGPSPVTIRHIFDMVKADE